MPLSKKHPTQRSSELTALQINHQQSKRNPLKSRPTNTCMHKTGFHWQYFDKSRVMTKKIQNRAYNTQKRRYFSCFYPKTSIKANIGTLKAISRTDTLRLSKKRQFYHGIRFNQHKFVKFVKKIRCSIICLYNFDQNNAKFNPFLVNMLCFISNFPTFCRFWHVTKADCHNTKKQNTNT